MAAAISVRPCVSHPGAAMGIFVFFCDAGKGVAAVLLAKWLADIFRWVSATGLNFILSRPCSGDRRRDPCSDLVHRGSQFSGLAPVQGRQGVATSAGVMFGLLPLASVVGFVVWVIVYYSTRYVSVASLTASCALALSVLVIPGIPIGCRSLCWPWWLSSLSSGVTARTSSG